MQEWRGGLGMIRAGEGVGPAGAPKAGDSSTGATNAIVDNRRRRVGDFLRDRIEAGSNLSIVSAYFTIYAYGALRDTLEGAGRVRFLLPVPRQGRAAGAPALAEPDPEPGSRTTRRGRWRRAGRR